MDTMKSHNRWQDIKAEVKNVWGNLTADEIETHGENISALSGLIQDKYGDDEETVVEKLESILTRFGPTTEDIKNLKNSGPANIQENYKH